MLGPRLFSDLVAAAIVFGSSFWSFCVTDTAWLFVLIISS